MVANKEESSPIWRTYMDLPPQEQEVLRAVSLFSGPLVSQAVADYLAAAGSNQPHWQISENIRKTCQRLSAKRLLHPYLGCHQLLRHALTVEEFGGPDAEKKFEAVRKALSGNRYFTGTETALSVLRLSFYRGKEVDVSRQIEESTENWGAEAVSEFLLRTFGPTELPITWISSREEAVQVLLLELKLRSYLYALKLVPDIRRVVEYSRERRSLPGFARLSYLLATFDLLSFELGEARKAAALLEDGARKSALLGSIAFLSGENEEALGHYRAAVQMEKRQNPRSKVQLLGLDGVFFRLCLLLADSSELLEEALHAVIQAQKGQHAYTASFAALEAVIYYKQGLPEKAEKVLLSTIGSETSGVSGQALFALAAHLANSKEVKVERVSIEVAFRAYSTILPVIGRIYAEILVSSPGKNQEYKTYLANQDRSGMVSFLSAFSGKELWARRLDALRILLGSKAPVETVAPLKQRRLAYVIDPGARSIHILEQTARSGNWSAGRDVALSRLARLDQKLDYLTDVDRRVSAAISTWKDWRGLPIHQIDFDKAICSLVGSPNVFLKTDPTRPVELVPASPELVVRDEKGSFRIRLSHFVHPARVVLEPETPTRVRVVQFTDRTRPLEELLGRDGILVPPSAGPEVLSLLRSAGGPVPIRADLKGLASEEAAEGDAKPVVQLVPKGTGLLVRIVVRPLGPEGPYYLPGEGGAYVLASLAGSQKRVSRDLGRERVACEALIQGCPALSSRFSGAKEFDIESLEASLGLLEELQGYPDPHVVEWPSGRPFSLAGTVSASSLRLRMTQKHDWFAVEGKIQVDEKTVLDFAELLRGLPDSAGRFLPLGDGRFLALTASLRKQLERLQSLSYHQGSARIHRLGAPILDDLFEEAGEVKADEGWTDHRRKLKVAQSSVPKVPALLQAELRDYQIEGFQWMSRLSRWGAGACLADDMGVGKTVQAIAVMLEKAKDGPCLVIAPTSVCPNWEDEIRRFAPVLEVHRLGSADDRRALVEKLGPMSVLVVSYALLHLESEVLSTKTWSVAILDEAQAIKNAETRRAQASLKLRADFRLALTGTPIENYLEELWSLFNFVNPGLLGSREAFQKRFAIPIDGGDPEARSVLKSIIRPFILRRTKNTVLSELPERIEKTLLIEMQGPERAFYEALRRRAIEKLEGFDEAEGGRTKIHILAEITRLRRACCHPRLVDETAKAESTKIPALLELVEELLRNRHKALVFSQFVGHLELVRAELDRNAISYQYLDGQTPAGEREKRVKAFQSGDGDLFLISLKAGGLGLNLTAADFVFHLDPWWNPAVEDQASDRAHRIGQTRPVTIYRLILKDTIEEKIVRLHGAKRNLAADLLSGTEMAGKMTEEELLDLIRA